MRTHQPCTISRYKMRVVAVARRALGAPGMRPGSPWNVARASSNTDQSLGSQLSADTTAPADKRKWAAKCKRFPEWRADLPAEYEDGIGRAPAYEHVALQQLHKLSYDSNVLLEVRDVRLPASTHHPSFTRLAAHRNHLICYTHADMIDEQTRNDVAQWTKQSWPDSDAFFCDTRQNRSADAFASLYNWIVTSMDEARGMNCALTTGVANTGKSSVLLSLLKHAKREGHIPKKFRSSTISTKGKRVRSNRKKAGTPNVEDVPGKTRDLTEWEVRSNPRLYFLDVPGVTQPYAYFKQRPEAWYGMAAANLVHQSDNMRKDPQLQRALCAYVLSCLNRDNRFLYVSKFRLDGPTDDVDECLAMFANKFKDRLDEDDLLLKRTETFLKFLNTGNLGSVVLDDLRRPYRRFRYEDVDEVGYSHDGGSDGSPRKGQRRYRDGNGDDNYGGGGPRRGRNKPRFDDDDDDWFKSY
ncbi:hypothetical protein ACHAXT_001329 [Thalassiosira profunda]